MGSLVSDLPRMIVCAILKLDSRNGIGYRILSLDEGLVKDIDKDLLIKGIKSGKVNVLNAKVEMVYQKDILGKIKIVNGEKVQVEDVVGEMMSFSNLPQINTRKDPKDQLYITANKNRYVYAVKHVGGKHKLVDYGGKVILLDDSDFKYYKSNLINIKPLVDETIDISKIISTPLTQRTGGFSTGATGMNQVSDELRRKTEEEIEKRNRPKPTSVGSFMLKNGDDAFKETECGSVYTMFDGGLILDLEGKPELTDYKNVGEIGAGYKISSALINLRALNYFYFSIIQELNRELIPPEDKSVETMAVSPSTLYINAKFADEHTVEELTFVLMHEAMHILFRHNYYGIGKEQEIHNVACDLIINKTITDEYGCLPGNKRAVTVDANGVKAGIKYPEGGCWIEAVNTEVDTSESIYHELITAIDKAKQSQGQGQGQSQGQGQGQSQGQGQGQGQSQGQGQGQSQGQGSGKGQGSGQGSYEIDFRGSKIKVEPSFRDIVLSAEDTKNGKEGVGDLSNSLARNAEEACKAAGKDISPLIKATLKIEAKIVAPRWQKVLKEFLSKLGEKYYTYSAVNKRYIHSGLIVPGPKTSEENSKMLENIVLAIDTSGSMFNDENLSNIVSLAASIVKKYKANGEIIYWDTTVTSTGTFKDTKSLVRTSVEGGGGTDVNCVFEYLAKKYPTRGRQPSLIIVMTDGYFGSLDDEYVKKYKNVIWAITEVDIKNFSKPPNGKVAVIDMK